MADSPTMTRKPAVALQQLLDELRRREPDGERLTYHVPDLWRPVDADLDGIESSEAATEGEPGRRVNPYAFYRRHLEAILAARPPVEQADEPASDRSGADWVRDAVIYNMFVRLATAYDHDHDGVLGKNGQEGLDSAHLTLNGQGVRESGTFLKALALLGHIRFLGCNAVHLLPITSVGRFGNKGNLGSPYAIRNAYNPEETLADPLVEADVDVQFRAFVEACHILGMKVIVEFVFRTASRDGDMIPVHPEWFYWIRREVEDRPAGAAPDDARYYGVPPFMPDELELLKARVAAHDFRDLPAPPAWYRGLFTAPPAPETVRKEPDGRYRGTSPEGLPVHVPSAFADWPPDDFQPPWTDVTYLRMYNDPPGEKSYNYIAYNTIRMYDQGLARPENANRPLWEAIAGIIPHYQKEFGIDGVMVDMGHAIPPALMTEIIDLSRREHPDFALLSENFVVSEESRETGYNAVLGYQFRAVETATEIRKLIERSCVEGLPIPCFGCGETHNTPRVAMRGRGAEFCRTVWLLNSFLPDTIPFLHNGFELGEARPVNLGLAFTPEEIATLGSEPLALFDLTSLDWDGGADLPAEMARIGRLRAHHEAVAKARGPKSLQWLKAAPPTAAGVPGSDDVVAFVRRSPGGAHPPLILILNWSTDPMPFEISADQLAEEGRQEVTRYKDLLTGRVFPVDGETRCLVGDLGACEGLLLAPVPM